MGPFPHDAPPATISKANPAGTDGFEFVEALRAKRGASSIPIVVLTAKDLTPAERQRLAGEAKKVLRKSLHSREELAAEIRRALSGDGARPHA